MDSKERSRRRSKAKRRSGIIQLVLLILAMALIVSVAFSYYLKQANVPITPDAQETISVEIPKGSSTGQIASLLESEGLIKSTLAFKLKARLDGYDGKFQAGKYVLSPSMTMKAMMDSLLVGHSDTVRFTIPEGFDLKKITERLSEEGLIDVAVFQQELQNGVFQYTFMDQLPNGADRLEGYLFPETYEVYVDADEHEIIDKMLSQFDGLMQQEGFYQRAEELRIPLQDIVILASVIEREAVVPQDRPIISGVFYNRLMKGMPLQSCATIQYILGEQKKKLSIADTKLESPYNTYLYTGLPPGPICSPGLDSIRAALYPAKTDYLYFLAKGDGSHVFSVTYDEFLNNKEKYID